ncbi:MAG: Arc family DNA-binding protein [Planctomycetota bacterium]
MARKPFLIRVDEDLLAELRRGADDDFRSLTGPIEFLHRGAPRERMGGMGSATEMDLDAPRDR